MKEIIADDCENVVRQIKIYRSTPDEIWLFDLCFPSLILTRKAPNLDERSLRKKENRPDYTSFC